MTFHSKLSASQTKRWATCPGSAAVLEIFPDTRESGWHAMLGTAAHALIERVLETGEEPAAYEGRIIELKNGNFHSILKKGAKWPKNPGKRQLFEVDQEMVEATEQMVRYVRHRMELLCVDRETLLLEERVNPLDRDDTGGTADVTLDGWMAGTLEIVDYKNGSGVFVPVEDNPQLKTYALGALRMLGAKNFDTVRYTICQPRHKDTPHDGVMSEEVSVAELLEWGEWLEERCKKVDEARATFDVCDESNRVSPEVATILMDIHGFLSPGDDGSACQWCPLIAKCPAAARAVQEAAGADFEDEPSEPTVSSDEGDLARALNWVPFIDRWVKEVEATAERAALSGASIPGYKLVRGRSVRRWKEELSQVDIAAELESHGVDQEDMWGEPKFITAPAATKLLPASERKGFEALFIEKPEGKPTLVPDSDKRDAISVDPGADFDEE